MFRGCKMSIEAQSMHTHSTQRRGRGVERGVNQLPRGGTFIDATCAWRKKRWAQILGLWLHNTCTNSLEQNSPGPESWAKQAPWIQEPVLTGIEHWYTVHSRGLRKPHNSSREACAYREAQGDAQKYKAYSHLGSQARGTKRLWPGLLSNTKYCLHAGLSLGFIA